ncbi:MAG: NAD-dependent epimerase/dehydratase family protein [Chitinophagaceae bacterium]|nr:NAD-dependent epimerase/dehydratase family protein [Chitinophagaceae bacterium]MCA6459652.1 NAD-dependent epimerase/dehydratase family protein [Chitinophagaceae bacterium]MCA6464519.1 NAD-dependent epimerase/dehydratase family protein [Chitinophagaceae bacterium]
MKVLITGGSGFLGGEIVNKFRATSGFEVKLLGRNSNSDYQYDLRECNAKITEKFDIVVHVAGKAHSIPKSEKDKQAFYDVNVKGTIRLLELLENTPPKSIVFISTVAVYGRLSGANLTEDTPLNAKDAYGKSKIMAEKYLRDWCTERNIQCVIFRLPLVIGRDAPGNLRSMVQAIRKGYYFNIEGGVARKSMVMASDVARAVVQAIGKNGTFHLTDGCHPSFFELSHLIAKHVGRKRVLNLPIGLAKFVARFGDALADKAPLNTLKLSKITSELTFDDTKARVELKWAPLPVLDVFKVS